MIGRKEYFCFLSNGSNPEMPDRRYEVDELHLVWNRVEKGFYTINGGENAVSPVFPEGKTFAFSSPSIIPNTCFGITWVDDGAIECRAWRDSVPSDDIFSNLPVHIVVLD